MRRKFWRKKSFKTFEIYDFSFSLSTFFFSFQFEFYWKINASDETGVVVTKKVTL
jgi:hypothetical protein